MNLDTLFDNPDDYMLAFEPPNAVFVKMDRAAYHRSIFCDMRISPVDKTGRKVDIGQLLQRHKQTASAAPEISYIFHMAHCGSTLLARALDLPDSNLVCREPLTLRQLAVEAGQFAGGKPSDEWQARLALTTSLLSRRYNSQGPVIVKANVPVNFIIPQLLEHGPKQPSIMLYFGLEHYLLAILRTQNHGKWVGSIINEMQKSIGVVAPLKQNMNIAEAAGSLWLSQIAIYADALSKNEHAASLNAEDLFNKPKETIAHAFAHFGQPQSDDKVEEIVSSELFARYSKNPSVAFDNNARLQRRKQLQQQLAPVIAQAHEWIATAVKNTPIPERLPKPLFGEAPELLAPA